MLSCFDVTFNLMPVFEFIQELFAYLSDCEIIIPNWTGTEGVTVVSINFIELLIFGWLGSIIIKRLVFFIFGWDGLDIDPDIDSEW